MTASRVETHATDRQTSRIFPDIEGEKLTFVKSVFFLFLARIFFIYWHLTGVPRVYNNELQSPYRRQVETRESIQGRTTQRAMENGRTKEDESTSTLRNLHQLPDLPQL